ncbi:hypothetical protein ACTWQF_09795 [Streptomyces sp. 8N114]
MRLPTEHLEVTLAFPAALDPAVWGTETSIEIYQLHGRRYR